jgi:hypothetical protein
MGRLSKEAGEEYESGSVKMRICGGLRDEIRTASFVKLSANHEANTGELNRKQQQRSK